MQHGTPPSRCRRSKEDQTQLQSPRDAFRYSGNGVASKLASETRLSRASTVRSTKTAPHIRRVSAEARTSSESVRRRESRPVLKRRRQSRLAYGDEIRTATPRMERRTTASVQPRSKAPEIRNSLRRRAKPKSPRPDTPCKTPSQAETPGIRTRLALGL